MLVRQKEIVNSVHKCRVVENRLKAGVYLGTRLLSCQLGCAACCHVIKGLAVELCYESL